MGVCYYIGVECIIDKNEKDLCCNNSRMCCIYCLDENCPIKLKYSKFIEKKEKKL